MLDFTEKQREYWNEAHHRWNIKTGATRSGKTFLDYYLLPKRIRACTGKGLIVLLGNTQSTLSRNILDPLRDIWSPSLVGNIASNNTVRLFGRKCYALGADRVSQVSKIQGSEIQYCYGDEVTTWNEEVFSMLKTRLSAPNSLFDGTCNPDAPKHWLKRFIDESPEKKVDLYCQRYTLYDNPKLSPDFVENLENELRGTVYFERFILGLWKAAEGIIYRQFADNTSAFLLPRGKIPDDVHFATVGVDFGGNGSAHSFTLTGFSRGLRKLYALDERYLKKQITPKELEEEFIAFVRRVPKSVPVFTAFCDSAETTLIRGLSAACVRSKIPIEIKNAEKGAVVNRVRFFQSMMAQGRFFVSESCPALIDALCSAVWKKSENVTERLDDGSTNIDSLDSLEYSAEPFMRDMIDLGGIRNAE